MSDDEPMDVSGPGGPGRGAGWHPDPWDPSKWRWWDGWAWTAHVSLRAKKPVTPAWLSIPVLIAMLFMVPWLIAALVSKPLVVLLAMVPLAIVVPVLLWLDRVEPEPKAELVHSLLWGGTVAVLVGSLFNDTVGALAGEGIAATISAPLGEEAMKALGILYAVRHRQLDGPMDGIVYAGWTAVGFAVVENVQYLSEAAQQGQLATVFVLRGLLSPFAHPLFTAWTGLAIGRAVARGRPVFPSMLWGYGLAVASHALWNGSTVAVGAFGDAALGFLARTVLAFVGLFVVFALVLYTTRRNEERRFAQRVPWMVERYGLTAHEAVWFGNFKQMMASRKRLTAAQRKWFDRMHTALARLALLHDRPGGADPQTEELLLAQLQQARFGTES